MLIYEAELGRSSDRGLLEGSLHFDEKSAVHVSLRKIASRLETLAIPYAVVEGMALFFHGVRRFTEDVDILLTAEGLAEAHRQLKGLGYSPPFDGSKQLRDVGTGVRIEFLVSGQFPGDGKPKPLAFPDPADVGVVIDGIRYLRLENLVELKLASGMTGGANRLKDLADVVELIKVLKLPADLGDRVDPFSRGKYVELWNDLTASANAPDDPHQ